MEKSAKNEKDRTAALRKKAAACVLALKKLYPEGICSLSDEDPFRLLVSVRLSAQCTDARVNQVTPALFERFPDARAFSEADIGELETMIFSCGFYRSKARDIKAAANMVLYEYGGRLPDTMEMLLKIPGVGRKSANLILGDVYGLPAVVADTHCIRISNRLGLCDSRDPLAVENRLKELLDPLESNDFCHRIVLFGRDICRARAPKCAECPLFAHCDRSGI